MERHIKWLMLVAGALTFTMLYAFLAPQAALQSIFGTKLEGPAAEIVVRNWGALVALAGCMLIYGALNPVIRNFALVIVSISKCIFIGLVLIYTSPIGAQLAVSIAVDAVFVLIFGVYLLQNRRSPHQN